MKEGIESMENNNHFADVLCNDIDLTTEEILKELEIVKADKGNEVIIDKTLSAKREYAALSKATEIIAEQAERENVHNKNYDEAIKYFEHLINDTTENCHYIVYDSAMEYIQAGLNALKALKDLQTKVKQHNMIAER